MTSARQRLVNTPLEMKSSLAFPREVCSRYSRRRAHLRCVVWCRVVQSNARPGEARQSEYNMYDTWMQGPTYARQLDTRQTQGKCKGKACRQTQDKWNVKARQEHAGKYKESACGAAYINTNANTNTNSHQHQHQHQQLNEGDKQARHQVSKKGRAVLSLLAKQHAKQQHLQPDEGRKQETKQGSKKQGNKAKEEKSRKKGRGFDLG